MDQNDNVKRNILAQYDLFLRPIVGQTELHDRLLKGLDSILFSSNFDFPKEDAQTDEILNSKIDFKSLPRTGRNLRLNAFFNGGDLKNPIRTYRDLIRHIEEKANGRSAEYGITRRRDVGKKTAEIILKHIENKGLKKYLSVPLYEKDLFS